MWEMVFAENEHGAQIGKNRIAFFQKKHPMAVAELFARVQFMVSALNAGASFDEMCVVGRVHREPGGIFAATTANPPLRLYCCLLSALEKFVVITLGDKRRQTEDIREARRVAAELRGA